MRPSLTISQSDGSTERRAFPLACFYPSPTLLMAQFLWLPTWFMISTMRKSDAKCRSSNARDAASEGACPPERDSLIKSVEERFDSALDSLQAPDTPQRIRKVFAAKGRLRKAPIAGPTF